MNENEFEIWSHETTVSTGLKAFKFPPSFFERPFRIRKSVSYQSEMQKNKSVTTHKFSMRRHCGNLLKKIPGEQILSHDKVSQQIIIGLKGIKNRPPQAKSVEI
jgi:hypothetical protein